jgi:hypothetical protein
LNTARLNLQSFDRGTNMTVAEETGELRNPGLPGIEEFDTLIYGSPPLAYPAALSQYVIYNTPDPAYVTGRINVSALATHRPTLRPKE